MTLCNPSLESSKQNVYCVLNSETIIVTRHILYLCNMHCVILAHITNEKKAPRCLSNSGIKSTPFHTNVTLQTKYNHKSTRHTLLPYVPQKPCLAILQIKFPLSRRFLKMFPSCARCSWHSMYHLCLPIWLSDHDGSSY